MKGFLVFLFCVVIAVSAYDKEWKESLKICADKEGFDMSKMDEVYKLMKEGGSEPEKNIKCFFACIMEAKKILGPDMSLNAEAAQEFAKKMSKGDEENVKKAMSVFKECAGQVKASDRCDRAWEYSKCSKPKLVELGIGRKGSKEQK